MWELTIACKKRRVMSSKGNLEKRKTKVWGGGVVAPPKNCYFYKFPYQRCFSEKDYDMFY